MEELFMNGTLEALLKGNLFNRAITGMLSEVGAANGLKKVDMEVLFFLSYLPDCDTPSEIAKCTTLTRGHVSQAIDSLIKAGLIEGEVDANDRRCTHYRVTEKAAPMVEEITERRIGMTNRVFSGLSEEQTECLIDIMKIVVNNMEELITEISAR